jgi:hypothetical protein
MLYTGATLQVIISMPFFIDIRESESPNIVKGALLPRISIAKVTYICLDVDHGVQFKDLDICDAIIVVEDSKGVLHQEKYNSKLRFNARLKGIKSLKGNT